MGAMAVSRRAVRAQRGSDDRALSAATRPLVAAVRRKPRPVDAGELTDVADGEAPTRLDVIRAVARRHFAEHGYDAASMRDIAADAGITIATLYFHCATKEQLLFDILERAMQRLSEALSEAVRRSGGTWADRLAAAVGVHVEFCARGDYGATISTSELRGLTGELREQHVATRDAYEQQFRALLQGGVEAGEFVETDVPVVTAGILSMGLGVGRWYRGDGRLTPKQIAAHYTRLIIDGLRPRTDTAASPRNPRASRPQGTTDRRQTRD